MSAINSDDKFEGVFYGCYTCQNDRVDELNTRISDRNIPSSTLAPQFDMRPVATKYGCMDVLDQYNPTTVPIQCHPTYSVERTFNPGNASAPWSGYAANVNVESDLRSQFFALQKSDQAKYVPTSSSDMYKVTVDTSDSNMVQQSHPLLFTPTEFQPFNPNTLGTGNNIFNNHTREQLKSANCEH